ncbi:MAG: hypothetical protein QG585_460 [Patescibacteria group bacterium]|nr:hypothetical protein [Patescibacteria group bacterium]
MKIGVIYPICDQRGRRLGFQALKEDGSVRGGLIGVPGLQTFRQSDQERAEQARIAQEARELMGPSAEELARRSRTEIQEDEWPRSTRRGLSYLGGY